MPDPRKKLYSALSSSFDLGSQEEFNSKMDRPESRKKLYEAVSSKFDLGSFEEFESKVAPLKKKDTTSPSTTPKGNTELAPKTGSSVSKNTQGFPEIDSNGILPDFDKMKSGSSVVEKPKTKLQKPTAKEDASFYEYLKDNLDVGITTVSKSIYDAPGLLYDAAASITNPIIKGITGYKGEGASADKLAKDLGFVNIPSEILKEKIKVSNEKINQYASKNGGDALKALENGNYSGAAKLVAGTTAQSLPIMIAAMASGGQSAALTTIGISTASTKNAQLKEENPEMGLGTRVTNAATSGVIEAVTGHLFTGASGAVMKKILADRGVEAGSRVISRSFTSTIQSAIEKNPFIGAIGEVVEETAVEFGNQANDIASGIRTEFDIHAIKNAGLSATGMGGINTVGVYGAKGYIKAKDYSQIKSVNKEIFKLQNELSNENLSAENKNIIGGRIDRLLSENKKLLGTELEKLKALPIETKRELNAINSDFDDIRTKVENINDDDNLSPDVRKSMLDELKVRAESAQKRKTEILSQNDGLEINNDFSNFNGVEPDFNIETQSKSDLKNGTYEYNGKIYKYDGKSLTDETGSNLYPLSFEEDSLLNQIKNKGKLINEAPQQTEAEKLAELNDFLNQLDPEEREETQTELDNSPTVKSAIDGPGTFTLNGEEGVLKIEGQQVVFETKNTINELGNVDEISESKLLEYGIEPVQELNIEVGDDYSVTIDGKSYKNTNSNPADAIVVGKNGEYSVNLINDKGQKRTIRGQKAEQIAYNYKLKELENGSEQQIDQATKDAEIAVNDAEITVSETDGNSKQPNKKSRTKKQRSLKQAKEPISKSEVENQEFVKLLAEEEIAKKNKKEAEDAEFQKLVAQEEDVQLQKMIQEEELAKKDPLFKEFIGLRDSAKRNKKQEIRFQKLNEVFKNKDLFEGVKPKEDVGGPSVKNSPIPKQGTEVVWNKDKNYRGVDSADTAIGEDVSWKKGGIFGEDAFILEFGDVEGQDATHQGTKRGDLTKAKIEKVYYAPDFWAEESMAKEELAKMKAKFPDAQFIEIEVFSPNNDNIIYGKNEATPPTNSPANRNVRPSVEPNALQGKNNKVQPAVDTKPSEGEVEITTKRVKSKTFANKESEYDVDFDSNGNIKEIRSAKDNRIIPKFVERTSKTKIDKTTNQFKKTISINPNWSKIEASAKGELTKNQLDILAKEERSKKVSEALDNFTPTNEYEVALEALAQGRKVSRESLKKETGNKDNNWATDKFSKVKLPSIEKLSEQIAEQYPDLDQTEIRNALIDIISSNKDIQQVQDRVIENYGENIKRLEEQELNAFLGSLSEKDLAMYQDIQAEEGYLSELSEKEAEEYYNQKLNEYEQGQQEYARAETANQGAENITKGNEAEVRNEGNQEGQEVKPIRQLGTGRNVYFEGNGIRVNDTFQGIGVVMNVQSEEEFGGMAQWNIPFDNATQAVQIAKQLSEIYPKGVPKAVLLENVVENMVNPREGVKKDAFEVGLEWLDNADKNLDEFGRENLSVGIPIVLAKGAIQAMRIALKAGKLASEVLQAGLDYVKQSDWYKNLNQQEKNDINSDFRGNFLNKINAVNPENNQQAEKPSEKKPEVVVNEPVKETPKEKVSEPKPNNQSPPVENKPTQKEKLNPSEKEQAFSTRAFNSENLNQQAKEKLEALGLNYDVENQEVAQSNAEKIISEIGILDAYNLAKDGKIRGGARTWIMAQMFEDINQQLDQAITNKDSELADYLSTELAEIIKTFADEKTLTGQETAMLNRIYNRFGMKYDLNFAKERWKKQFGSEIPVEVEARLSQLEKQLKDLETDKKALEKRIGTLEEQEAINNLKNQAKRIRTQKPSASSLSRAANALRQTKFTKTISDLANLQSSPLGVVTGIFDGAVETIAKALDAGATIEQAVKKGIIEIKNSNWYKGLSPASKIKAEAIAEQNFKDFIKQEASKPENDSQKSIKIPYDLLYDLVSNGVDNIQDLTNEVRNVLLEDYPNITHREVRDAITGYGTQMKETKDEIRKEISRLKTDGKQMSALDDLAEGNLPKRSGRKPKNYTPEQRNRIKQIRELIKKIPVNDSKNKEEYYKTALEGYKTRVENRIKDLNDALAKNERIINEKRNLVLDQTAKDLVEQRDALQKEYDDHFGKPYKSDETLINEIVKRKEKSLRDLEVKLETVKQTGKELPVKEKRIVTDPKIDELTKQIEAKREELNDVLEQVGIAESKRLKQAINYSKRRLKELNTKLANGDFTRPTPRKVKYNDELIKLKGEIIIAKTKWDIEFEKEQFRKLNIGEKLLEYVYRAFGTVKGLKATADLSAMLRQGILLGSRNPKEFKIATAEMHKFVYKESYYKKWMTELETSKDFVYMVEDGLSITDSSGDVLKAEERFVGTLLNKKVMLNGFNVNIIGRLQEGSERAYGGFLNSLRVSVYRKLVAQYEVMGITREEHPKKFKNIAKFVNNATGRGVMSSDKRIAKVLNIAFFSPRMITGMAGVFKDMVRTESTPYLRKQAATSLLTFVGYQFAMKTLIASALGLLSSDDDDEEITMDMNPVSTDFNKVKKGDTRYDVSAGYGIAARTASRFFLNKKSSGIDEEDKSFEDIYMQNRYSEVGSFFINKLSPLASQVYKYSTNKHPTDFYGDIEDATIVDYGNAFFVPISINNFIEDIEKETPENKLFFDLLLNTYGVSVQKYE